MTYYVMGTGQERRTNRARPTPYAGSLTHLDSSSFREDSPFSTMNSMIQQFGAMVNDMEKRQDKKFNQRFQEFELKMMELISYLTKSPPELAVKVQELESDIEKLQQEVGTKEKIISRLMKSLDEEKKSGRGKDESMNRLKIEMDKVASEVQMNKTFVKSKMKTAELLQSNLKRLEEGGNNVMETEQEVTKPQTGDTDIYYPVTQKRFKVHRHIKNK